MSVIMTVNVVILFSDSLDSLPRSVIMVETSGKGSLDPRQACSVEAAAKRSGLGVVVVMTSGRLDLTDNTTCYLVNSHLNIQFYAANLTNLGRNTSIGQYMNSCQAPHNSLITETFLRTPDLLSKMIAAHKSDILR